MRMKIIYCLIVAAYIFTIPAQANEDYIKLKAGTEYFVAVSPAKYDHPDNAFATIVLFEKTQEDKWERTGYQLFPPQWDTLALTVIGDKIILVNHRNERSDTDGIVIYDINSFFQKNPGRAISKPPLHVLNSMLRPLAITSNGTKFSVAFTGEHNFAHGVHIYDLNKVLAGNSEPDVEISYNELGLGRAGPAAVLFYKNYLIVSNHFSATIDIFDISKAPQTVTTIPAGSKNRLYYPFGLAVHGDVLYVGDHIHDFINAYDLSDMDDIKLLRSFGGKDSELSMPFNLYVYDDKLFVANIQLSPSITAYSLAASGNTKPLYTIKRSDNTLIKAPADIMFFRYE